MKCYKCGSDFTKVDTGYICPKCGTSIIDESASKTKGNRLLGCFIFVLGFGIGGFLIFQGWTNLTLTIFDIPIPFALECVGVIGLVWGFLGLLASLGILDATKLINK